MPRKNKRDDPEPEELEDPPGETLPPIEDFVRKMSTKFNPDTFGDDNKPSHTEEESDSISEEEE
jgi:hypothetical protein